MIFKADQLTGLYSFATSALVGVITLLPTCTRFQRTNCLFLMFLFSNTLLGIAVNPLSPL